MKNHVLWFSTLVRATHSFQAQSDSCSAYVKQGRQSSGAGQLSPSATKHSTV